MGTRQQLANIQCQTITLRGTSIHISTEVTCRGVVIDSELKFALHIKRLAERCFINLGSFAQSDVHSTLMQHRLLFMHSSQVVLIIAIVLAMALVQSIFHPIPSVLNASARLIVKKRKFDQIAETIQNELH